MTNVPEVRYRRVRRTPDYATTRYEVVVDGETIGEVYTAEVSHDRKPRGSRIVTSRTYSDRWFAQDTDHRRVGGTWRDTRKLATELLLERRFKHLAWRVRDLAIERARNFRKGEEVSS
jgi:hypothetical protein